MTDELIRIDDKVSFPSSTFCKCTTGIVLNNTGNMYIVQLDEPDAYGQKAHLMHVMYLTKLVE